jgi:hypothetical protein
VSARLYTRASQISLCPKKFAGVAIAQIWILPLSVYATVVVFVALILPFILTRFGLATPEFVSIPIAITGVVVLERVVGDARKSN